MASQPSNYYDQPPPKTKDDRISDSFVLGLLGLLVVIMLYFAYVVLFASS